MHRSNTSKDGFPPHVTFESKKKKPFINRKNLKTSKPEILLLLQLWLLLLLGDNEKHKLTHQNLEQTAQVLLGGHLLFVSLSVAAGPLGMGDGNGEQPTRWREFTWLPQ